MRRRAVIRRRQFGAGCVAAALLVLVVVVAWGPSALGVGGRPGVLVLSAGDRALARIALDDHVRRGRLDGASVGRAVARVLPATADVSRGRARITYRYDVQAAIARAEQLGPSGGTVQVARRPVSAAVTAPVFQQAQPNTCESAALSILLATAGKTVDQNELQQALPTSGPLDPVGTGPERVWGDPELGYVGRPEGGGVAGGFGVLVGPVRATARRYGVNLRTLTGRSPQEVYRRLLEGRAVMAWIGLSDGPYGEWRSPEGRRVQVNFGEHTVVLYGIRSDGALLVSNPLEGTDEVWTKAEFERLWERLDRRALAL